MASESVSGSDRLSWWQLGQSGWWQVLKNTARQFGSDEVMNLAKVVALGIVLSLVPSMIAGVAIAAQVISQYQIDQLITRLQTIAPESAQEFIGIATNAAFENLREGGTVAIILSILMGVWAASGAAAALVKALDQAFNVEESRGFIKHRLVSLVVILMMFVALTAMFVAIVMGPTLVGVVVPDEVLTGPVEFLLTLGRYALAVIILVVFFGFTLWFAPNHHRSQLRILTPGSVSGVIGWLLLSFAFAQYVQRAGSYSETYGSFAGVIVMILWLIYTFVALIMAAELDSEIARYLDEKAVIDTSTKEIEQDEDLSEALSNHMTKKTPPKPTRPRRKPPKMHGAAKKTSGTLLGRILMGWISR